MDEEEKVLISRTRVNKERWNKLGDLAEILTRVIGKDVTKERLVDLAIESLLHYYRDRFQEAKELESKPIRGDELIRSARRAQSSTYGWATASQFAEPSSIEIAEPSSIEIEEPSPSAEVEEQRRRARSDIQLMMNQLREQNTTIVIGNDDDD